MLNFQKYSTIVVILLLGSDLTGCGKSSNSTSNSSSLSSDQKAFESIELNGGAFSLNWRLPFGGGKLIPNTHYIFSTFSGGLKGSPLNSPQIQNPTTQSLDSVLPVPAFGTSRIIQSGKILLSPPLGPRSVNYSANSVQLNYLTSDELVTLTSVQLSDYSQKVLSGYMGNSPEELLAAIPLEDWIGFGNFSASAKWKPGASYIKRQAARIGEVIFAEDCSNASGVTDISVANPRPCTTATTLDNFFPIALGISHESHVSETDFVSDGVISTKQGLRMWVANSPRPADQDETEAYRVFFELDGNVYEGFLEKDGARINYKQHDGSFVDYSILLNGAAIDSIQNGLITGTSVQGSEVGNTAEVSTIDLFGIGGHGPNGSLSPVDLRSHYNVPNDLSGSGQTIAIVDAPGSGDFIDDLNVYSQFYGLPLCNVDNHCFQHFDLSNGSQAFTDDWGGEVALDVEMVHAIAPQAKIILVTAASEKGTDVMAAINYAAALPGVIAVSMSFAYGSSLQADEDPQLAKFQSQGMIFFAASGDDGNLFSGAGYPAISPYVTGVGGTRINSVTWQSPQTSEVAWQFSGSNYNTNDLMPSWQSAVLAPAITSANSGHRSVPDVAAVADFQHSAVGVYYKQAWQMSGGTSASTPIWAGMSALFGEYLARKGKSLPALVKATEGGFNGIIYQLSISQGANSGFYDIVQGSNNLNGKDAPLCSTGPGYDNVTGLGVPNVSTLFSHF